MSKSMASYIVTRNVDGQIERTDSAQRFIFSEHRMKQQIWSRTYEHFTPCQFLYIWFWCVCSVASCFVCIFHSFWNRKVWKLLTAQCTTMYRRMWEMWRKSRRRDCQSECWKCVDFRCDLVKTTHEFISIFEIFINHLQIHWPNLTHSNTEQLKHQAFAIKDTEFGWQFHRVIWSY